MTLVNDINLAAIGEQWRGVARGVDDFAFLSVGTGLGMGLVLDGELHQGRHGAAGELDYGLVGFGEGVDPCASAVSALAAELVAREGAATALVPPYEPREVFAAARRGDPLAEQVVAEVARRIALHIAPSRQWPTSASSCSEAVSARTATCCSTASAATSRRGCRTRRGSRSRASARLPSSPARSQSGLRAALDNVFRERRVATSRSVS